MSSAVHEPVLEDDPALRVRVDGSSVRVTTGHLTPFHRESVRRGVAIHRLENDLLAIARVHGRIPVAVKHDDRCGAGRRDAASS